MLTGAVLAPPPHRIYSFAGQNGRRGRIPPQTGSPTVIKAKVQRLFEVLAVSAGMAVAASVAQAAEIEWKFFTYFPANDKPAQMNREFVADILKSSGGRFNITLYTPGEMPYKLFDAIKIVATNKVQMADVAPGAATEVPELNVFTMPFLCTDYDAFYKALSAAEGTIDETMRQKFGVSVLFNWTMPANNLWLTPNVKQFSDLTNLKIRIWNPIHVPILKLWNAVPVSITSAEVAPALQRKVIDGAFTSSLSAKDWKLYEMIGSGFLPNFSMGHNLHMVNVEELNKLPPDMKKLLLDKSKEWAVKFRAGIGEAETVALKVLSDNKVALNKPTAEDLTKTRALMQPIWTNWANEAGPTAQKLLTQVRQSCGS